MDKRGILEVKKLDVLSIGKISALLGAFFGLVLGILSSFIILWASKNPTFQSMGYPEPTISSLIISPFYSLLIAGLFSGITGIICSLAYNLIAKTGGIRFSV